MSWTKWLVYWYNERLQHTQILNVSNHMTQTLNVE